MARASVCDMVEDDHKLIVETETVEAPVSGLLIASTGAGNKDNVEAGAVPAGMKTVVSTSMASKNEPGSSLRKGEGVLSGSNINLIDHNPLSPHATQVSLRNKKSSLLIDSSGSERPRGDDGGKGKDDVLKPRKHMDEIANANRDDADSHQGRMGGDGEPAAPQSFHSSKASSAIPTPLMLPVAVAPTSTVSATTGTQTTRPSEPKTFKIMERPSMSVANSREVLLDDEVVRKKGGPSARDEQVTGSTNKNSAAHTDDHDLDSLHKPTKADFFAARLASAVGENEISDSEETFIYESAANSTKNAIAALGLEQNDHGLQTQHGIASKMSVPVLNSNAKLLTRLKNTRHTSMSALPTGPMPAGMAAKQAEFLNGKNEPLVHPMAPPMTSTPNGELDSINSQNVHRMAKQPDVNSVRSLVSETRSPEKRLSLTSLAKGVNCVGASANATKGHTSRKPSISNSTLRHVSSSQAGTARGKYAANNSTKPEPDVAMCAGNKRNLRTTASKIFDANGAPLRRYSGVPDDINLEDFIEQSNGHLMPSVSNQKDDRVKADSNHITDKRFSRDLVDQDPRSAIQEEEGEDNGEEDDMRSMFYYNDRGDLEARPQISDYEEDADAIDDDHHDDKYFNMAFNPGFGSSNNRQTRFFESGLSPSDAHFPPNGFVSNLNNPSTIVNEQTPLKPRKQFSRPQLSYSPHNFYTRKSSWAKIKHCVYFTFVVTSLLTVGFILGFLLATNKELQDFNIVVMDNVLSSSDELLFDITVSAFNPGFFAIGVQDVNLDVFAKSSHISKTSSDPQPHNAPTKETILLGTVTTLETPLKFEGGFIRRNYDVSRSTVKLFDPGSKQESPDDDDLETTEHQLLKQAKDDVEKWKLLINHEYELIVRGSMQYKVPFFRTNKSVAVQNSASVRPGRDGDDDDKYLL